MEYSLRGIDVATRRTMAEKAIKKTAASKAATKASPHPVKIISPRDVPLVERLRAICLAFPEAGERLSHGEPTWFAGRGKVFAMLDNHHHGSAHLAVWLPQPVGVQQALIEAEPKRFFRPPYVGSSGWVGVFLDTRPRWSMVQHLVHQSFVHVAAKKLVARLLEQGEPGESP